MGVQIFLPLLYLYLLVRKVTHIMKRVISNQLVNAESQAQRSLAFPNKLKDELTKAFIQYFKSRGVDEEDILDYTKIEVIRTQPNEVKAEVRSEYIVDFDDQLECSEYLDKVVSKYDKDAYFEAEDAGISVAYLRK